jgi:anti-sigma factor RsiW
MNTCERSEAVRDYAFDELPASERREMEQHLAACSECVAELDGLRLTTAALRSLPDREIPQRIAFISDKVFEPSPVARFFRSFASPWAGFASTAVMAAVLLFTALHRPPEARTVIQTASGADVSKQIDDAVAKAVAQVRTQDAASAAQVIKAALDAAELKHQQEHRMLVAAMEQNLEYMQKRMGTLTTLASVETTGGGQ